MRARTDGNDVGYGTIAASGPNACILHWTRNDRAIRGDELLLLDAGVECIAGNYDVAIGRRQADCGCGYADAEDNAFAAVAYDYTFRHTSAEFADWMTTLPTERRESVDGVDVHLVHGSPLALNDFWWESLPDEQHRLRIAASGADVICCTHSGMPWIRRFGGDDRRDDKGDDRGEGTGAEGRETLVVNVGVIGRPANDGGRHVWYALLDCADPRAEERQWGRLPPDTGAERRLRAEATLLRWQAEARAKREREAAILDAYRAGVKWREIVERYGIPKTTLYELLAKHAVATRRWRKRGPRSPPNGPGIGPVD